MVAQQWRLTSRQAANNVAEPGLLPAVAWLVRYLQKPTTSAFLARLNVAALARAANKKGEVRKLDAGDEWGLVSCGAVRVLG